MNEIDFSKLSDEEKEALEKECMKHLYIIDFLNKHGVLADKLNVEIIASIRAQANKQLEIKLKQEKQKDIVDIVVTDGEKKTYENTNFLKSIGLRWDANEKVWYGSIEKDRLSKLQGFSVKINK